MVGRKVGIVGAGFVGATAAYSLTILEACHEVVLYDVVPNLARGKAIDIAQSANYSPQGTIVTYADEPSQMKDCDIVVVTAGVPRKDGMTRADLLNINAKIMQSVVDDIVKNSPKAIILVVSNPLDVMTYMALKQSAWDRNRVIGMAGALDGSRMAYQIHKVVGYGSGQTRALVIGDHGENMVPYPQISTVGGIPLEQIITQEDMETIINRTKQGGAEIVKCLGTSAYYAPGRAISVMVKAILDDSRIVMPSSVYLDGEYGYRDVCVGVPIVLGSKGIEQVIEVDLIDDVKEKFAKSVEAIKGNIALLQESGFLKN